VDEVVATLRQVLQGWNCRPAGLHFSQHVSS
jgi:hypothetical protein